jgi:RNA-binding protein 23/39
MSNSMNSDVIMTMDVAPSSGLEREDVHESKKQDDSSGKKESSNGVNRAKEGANDPRDSDGKLNGSSLPSVNVTVGASNESSTSVATNPKMIDSNKKESSDIPKTNGVSKEISSSSNNGAQRRTEEEEKLRKRLHAKREEDRLRDIIKRKKESFRNKNSISNGGSNMGSSNHSNDGNHESKEAMGSFPEAKKDEGKVTNNAPRGEEESRGVALRDPNRRTDQYERRPPHSMGRRDRRRRDRHQDRPSDRRAPPPQRHSGRPPSHFRDDQRGRPPPPQGPYDSYYDPRRPPHHGRGDEVRPFRRNENIEDIDHFGRRRRSVPDPMVSRRYSADDDNDHRRGKRRRSRSRSSDSRSTNTSASSSASSTRSSDSSSRRRKRRRSRSSSSDRSHRSNGSYSSGSRSRPPSSSSSTSTKNEMDKSSEDEPSPYSKDQRTIFVTQLVMRTTIKDIKKFFKEQDIKVNEIELLRDRRSGHHKGSAYVELKRMIDVAKAVNLSGHAPSFQRFPIMIKASEAERNYVQPLALAPLSSIDSSNVSPTAINAVAALQQQLQLQAMKVKLPPLKDENGRLIQAQKVYVGNLEVSSVTSQHLQVLFAPFGTLTEIQLQHGKGFAFLQYHDPKEAALSIQTMAGQILAGRPMKTGWATNQVLSINGVAVVTSNEFPPDAAVRVQNAYQVLAQLTNSTTMAQYVPSALSLPPGTAPAAPMAASSVPTVADARASLAAVAAANSAKLYSTVGAATVPSILATSTVSAPDPMVIGNADHPSPHLLIHNMFNRDEETEVGWEKELRDEFIEECSKYGTIVNVIVVSREVGGKIYASFDDVAGAQTCARSLAGRWFDRKQLRVEFTTGDQVQRIEKEYSSPSAKAASTTAA